MENQNNGHPCPALHFSITYISSKWALELCPANMRLLRSLSLSYQRKDWWLGPYQSCLWYDNDFIISSCFGCFLLIFAKKTYRFFWYDNSKDLERHVFAAHHSSVNEMWVLLKCIVIYQFYQFPVSTLKPTENPTQYSECENLTEISV